MLILIFREGVSENNHQTAVYLRFQSVFPWLNPCISHQHIEIKKFMLSIIWA
jgi:hypothetical protein